MVTSPKQNPYDAERAKWMRLVGPKVKFSDNKLTDHVLEENKEKEISQEQISFEKASAQNSVKEEEEEKPKDFESARKPVGWGKTFTLIKDSFFPGQPVIPVASPKYETHGGAIVVSPSAA